MKSFNFFGVSFLTLAVGSAWEWDEHTGEYYLHLYATDQPDLNWDNAECREAIYEETMRFWLERGVDGFRIDTVNKYSKRRDFVVNFLK